MENNCEILSLYITNELSEHEEQQFEHHLKTCINCQNEMGSFQNTWQTLAYDLEKIDVPESLKTEVMDFIFNKNNEITLPVKKQLILEKLKLFLAKQFSPLSIGITSALLIILIGLSWNYVQIKGSISAINNKDVSPAQVIRIFNIKGQDLASSASGIAYLIQKDYNTSLVVTLNNMPKIKSEEVYQVWLLKNGIRQNAGTLKPDHNGNGLLSYRLPKDYVFDGIGITLEQTPNHTQPKGKKVMGTS